MNNDDGSLSKDEKEDIQDILNDIDRDMKLPPYDNNRHSLYSKRYKEFKEEEKHARQISTYEEFCNRMAGYLNLEADKSTINKLNPAISLLGWNLTPGMVLSATVGAAIIGFLIWMFVFAVNMLLGAIIPVSLMAISAIIPFGVAVFVFYKPKFEAKNKVIRSSGEMILAILYMVVYMRSSPNLEGAVRFAALNLDGPISDDLKEVLWNVEVGEYANIESSLENYTKKWKDYNDDFLQSLNLIKASMNEPGAERRNDMLQDAIDTILDGTREEMKHYAQGLKTPVMILNALGAMLPVLAMIMLPLISVFMGDAITPLHLIILFNIMLPASLYVFMQRVLSSRPPTVSSSSSTDQERLPERGVYRLELMDSEVEIPTWMIGTAIFVFISAYGFLGYLAFPAFYPVSDVNLANVPGIFISGESLAPIPMLLRSVSITLGLGLGIGISKVLGNMERKAREEEIHSIEKQFPTALFQLGNKISGGTPIEVALEDAAEATSDMEISQLFNSASSNIHRMGMTFEESLFDNDYGAVHEFPSDLISTVMRAIIRSSEKGNKMAAQAMLTISRYLENIHETQEKLNDLMEDTTTTIQMLAYMLAPVVSGVAVGMSQTIITSMFGLSTSFQDANAGIGSGGAAGGGAAAPGAGGGVSSFGGILGNLDEAIPPELLQLVVGVYLIQLLYLLGTFYMKITKGENQTYRQMFIGKVMIAGLMFYTMTVLIVALMFGGMVGDIGAV